MIDDLIRPFTFVAALACGLMGGFFFAFSVCVMRALASLPASAGIAAMQSINIVVINPLFLSVFLGTGALSVALSVFSLLRSEQPGATYTLIGSLLYLVGSVLVTFVFNVPRNNVLAALEPSEAEAASIWTDYVKIWTAWNHVRTISALAAALSFSIALYYSGHQ